MKELTEREWIAEEYSGFTRATSKLARSIMGMLSVTLLVLTLSVPLLCIIYFTLELLQYLYLSIRAELMLEGLISIESGNRIRWPGLVFFYSKVIIAIVMVITLTSL